MNEFLVEFTRYFIHQLIRDSMRGIKSSLQYCRVRCAAKSNVSIIQSNRYILHKSASTSMPDRHMHITSTTSSSTWTSSFASKLKFNFPMREVRNSMWKCHYAAIIQNLCSTKQNRKLIFCCFGKLCVCIVSQFKIISFHWIWRFSIYIYGHYSGNSPEMPKSL